MNLEQQPQAIDIEKAVLGTLLIESKAIDQVELDVSDFYYEPHELIFKAILTLKQKRNPIDTLTVVEELNRTKRIQDVGGIMYVAELSNGVASSAHLEYHAAILKQKSLARKLILQSQNVIARAFDQSEDVQDIVEFLEKSFTDITTNSTSSGYHDMKESIDVTLKYLADLQSKKEAGEEASIPTGLKGLDDQFSGGWSAPDLVILGGRASMGKALKMDAKILTPSGWVLNKDLKVGDKVSSIDGKDSYVTGVFPQGKKQFCKINFIDGRSAECSVDHLWEVNSSRFKETRVITTLEIEKLLQRVKYKSRLNIPLFEGDYGIEKDFVIPPYLLGVLLGDGCLGAGVVFHGDYDQVVDKIKSYGLPVNTKGIRHQITWGHGKSNYLWEELKRLGLAHKHSYDKFIPSEYFTCSREQRLELLNGLLDTDGSCDLLGSVGYSSVSEQLAKDVQRLCWSLGYRCSNKRGKSFLYDAQHRDRFRLVISKKTENELFTLTRKKDRIKPSKHMPLTITSVELLDKKVECQCISVSHERELFIMDDYIVTHNTQLALKFARTAAKSNNHCLFISIEMTLVQLMMRIFTEDERVQFYNMKTGQMRQEEWGYIDEKIAEIQSDKLFIADDHNIRNLNNIKSLARNLHRKGQLKIMIIDYLQLIKTNLKFGTRDLEIGYITGELKSLAKELDIPIILLAQLNRGIKGQVEQIPVLSDLRESGNIEQDADKVIFPHRPTYYNPEAVDKDGRPWENRGVLIIAKNREGAKDEKVYFCHDDNFKKIYDDDEVFSSFTQASFTMPNDTPF